MCECYLREVHCENVYLSNDTIPTATESLYLHGVNGTVQLSSTTHLQLLSICDSQLDSTNLFMNNTTLLALIIENTNMLRNLISYQFLNFHQLRYLNLQHIAIYDIPKFAFYGLLYVENLDMDHLEIRLLNDYSFYGMDALRLLNLSGNYISNLPSHSFLGLNSLERLDLQGNNLWTIDSHVFQSFLGILKVDEKSVCCFAASPSNCTYTEFAEDLTCERLLPKYLKYCFHLVCVYLLVIVIIRYTVHNHTYTPPTQIHIYIFPHFFIRMGDLA